MNDTETLLEKIKDFADRAHGEQLRKYTPERYIVHPVRVMRTCQQVSNDLAILAPALLHDVLEDTPTNEHEISRFLTPLIGKDPAARTLKLVIELTDVYITSKYPRLNRRERKAKEAQRMSGISADAQTIKYADILDNSREIVTQDTGFAPTYLKESRSLIKVMTKGNESLRAEVLNIIEKRLKLLE